MVGEKGEMTTTPLEPEKHSLLSNSFSPKGHQSNESRGLMYSLVVPAENPIFTLVERGPPLRLFCCAASNAMIAFHMLSNWLEKGEWLRSSRANFGYYIFQRKLSALLQR